MTIHCRDRESRHAFVGGGDPYADNHPASVALICKNRQWTIQIGTGAGLEIRGEIRMLSEAEPKLGRAEITAQIERLPLQCLTGISPNFI